MDNAVRVIQAMVDIAANNGHLYAALRCMTLLQCVVQGRWWYDSTLLQLPHVERAHAEDLASRFGVHHIAELVNAKSSTLRNIGDYFREKLEPQEGDEATVGRAQETMSAIRRLPLLDVIVKTAANLSDHEYRISVELIRLSDPGKRVAASRFSKAKDEQYWVVVGHEATGELIAIKRINRLWRNREVTLSFTWDEEWAPRGETAVDLQVYVVCDSFIGLDQQYTVKIRR
jgi:activating signal cointegrator complex subunit 3